VVAPPTFGDDPPPRDGDAKADSVRDLSDRSPPPVEPPLASRVLGRTTLLQSLNCAYDGLVHAFRYQRNMRIHFALGVAVLVAGLFFDLSRLELLAVLTAITFVLVAELANTAIEAAIDLFTDRYDPRARVAKDVAASAVLVAAVNALAVAYLVFDDHVASLSKNVLSTVRRSPDHLTLIALLLVVLLAIAMKAGLGGGRPFSGGMPSGHAAVAFAGWASVTYLTSSASYGLLVSAVTFLMAALTAQSRVESGIHTTWQVVVGAVMGILVATVVFQFLY
jgi:diacylglycerol kinase (ATP)